MAVTTEPVSPKLTPLLLENVTALRLLEVAPVETLILEINPAVATAGLYSGMSSILSNASSPVTRIARPNPVHAACVAIGGFPVGVLHQPSGIVSGRSRRASLDKECSRGIIDNRDSYPTQIRRNQGRAGAGISNL